MGLILLTGGKKASAENIRGSLSRQSSNNAALYIRGFKEIIVRKYGQLKLLGVNHNML